MPRLLGLLVLRLALGLALRGADRLSRNLGGAAMWACILCGVRR